MTITRITGDPQKKYISNITLPSNNSTGRENFEIKDNLAWNKINELVGSVTKVMNFRGNYPNSDAALPYSSETYGQKYFDGSTAGTYPVYNSESGSYTEEVAQPGDVIIVGENEYIWNGQEWNLFGSNTGSFGALAFSSEVESELYTPNGYIYDNSVEHNSEDSTYEVPEFRGAASSIETVVRPPQDGNLWKVSVPVYDNNNLTLTGAVNVEGNVNVNISNTGTGNQGKYTPSGTVAYPPNTRFTSSEIQNWQVRNSSSGTEDTRYVPSGSVNISNISARSTKVSIPQMSIGTTPSWNASVQNENLTIDWNAGTMTSYVEDGSGGVVNYEVLSELNGLQATASFTGTPVYFSAYGQPYVEAKNPNFTGSSVYLSGNMAENNDSLDITVTGAIRQTGSRDITVTAEGGYTFSSKPYTPQGSIYANPANKSLVFQGVATKIRSYPVNS